MAVNSVFYPLKILFKNLKIILPLTLIYVPYVVVLLLALLLAPFIDFNEMFLNLLNAYSSGDYSFFSGPLFSSIILLVIFGVTAVIASLLIIPFVLGIYPTIAKQALSGKKIELLEAMKIASNRYLSMLGTLFLTFIGYLVLVVIFLGLISISTLLGPVVAIVGIILYVISIVLVAMLSWFVPSIVILREKSGFSALGESFSVFKKNFWKVIGIFILTTVIAIIINLIATFLGSLITLASPTYIITSFVASYLLQNIVTIFLLVWVSLIPSIIYLTKVRKPE